MAVIILLYSSVNSSHRREHFRSIYAPRQGMKRESRELPEKDHQHDIPESGTSPSKPLPASVPHSPLYKQPSFALSCHHPPLVTPWGTTRDPIPLVSTHSCISSLPWVCTGLRDLLLTTERVTETTPLWLGSVYSASILLADTPLLALMNQLPCWGGPWGLMGLRSVSIPSWAFKCDPSPDRQLDCRLWGPEVADQAKPSLNSWPTEPDNKCVLPINH